MSSSVLFVNRSTGPGTGWLVFWATVGLMGAIHHRFFHGLSWEISLWWGLKDWLLWGVLALLILQVTDRIGPESGVVTRTGLNVVLAALVLITHATIAVGLSFLVEYRGELTLVESASGHLWKRLPLHIAVYAAIVAFGELRRVRDAERMANIAEGEVPAERLLIRTRDRQFFIGVDSIDRIEAEGNYSRIVSREGSHLERRTLKSLAALLPSSFIRIHRSHIVNLDRVERIENLCKGAREVVLADGTRLPMGRTFKKELEELIGRRF